MQATIIIINQDGSTTPSLPNVQPGDSLIWFNTTSKKVTISVAAGYLSLTKAVTFQLKPNEQSEAYAVLRFGLEKWQIQYTLSGLEDAKEVLDPSPKEIVVNSGN